MSRHVVVEFKQYFVPVWGKTTPFHVPIAPFERRCRGGYCTRKQIPLRLAWEKTLHTFEVSNSGPTPEGKPKNSIQIIVIDVGKRADDAHTCGLTYTAVLRPTTLGYSGSEDIIPYK
jgi:hypothetical protein